MVSEHEILFLWHDPACWYMVGDVAKIESLGSISQQKLMVGDITNWYHSEKYVYE
jgi:hypothetical protein